ncbi:MAG: antibiotic biosynthesis monooxygenase [Deltaproteobacteria bacterium]|nr:antibiotic biosynthesis monooxygenase [Deltaproteobacteria bacterium]
MTAVPAPAPSAACVEVATFRARPGLAPEEVTRALAAASRWLAGQPGFLGRRLFHDPAEETWLDQVEWRSADDAARAMAAYPGSPVAPALDRVVDPASFRCLHVAPVSLPSAE